MIGFEDHPNREVSGGRLDEPVRIRYRNFHDLRDAGWDAIKKAHPDIPPFWGYVPLPAVRLRTIVDNLKRTK